MSLAETYQLTDHCRRIGTHPSLQSTPITVTDSLLGASELAIYDVYLSTRSSVS